MSESKQKTVDVVTVTLPRQTWCGLCGGKPLTDEGKRIVGQEACPQCGGNRANPFAPMPFCGVEGCGGGGVALAGYDAPEDAPERHPIYRCSAGHHTRIVYVDADDPELVAAGSKSAKAFVDAMEVEPRCMTTSP